MFGKLGAAWSVFKQGQAVANPAAWKKGQITATMLGGLFIAVVQLAKSFGYDIPMDADTATAIAGGIITLINWVLTITTSKHVGFVSGQSATGSMSEAEPVATEKPVSGIDEATRKRAEEFIRDTYKG